MEVNHDSSERHLQRIISTGLSDLIFYKSSQDILLESILRFANLLPIYLTDK
ncbi:MAG: hypothetical protein QMB39_05790 [Bacteroidales bacterium]